MCPRCGNLRSECSNPDVDWHPRTSTCFATATTEWARRRLDAKYEGVKVGEDALHPLEGVTVWVSEVPPDDDEDEFA